MGVACGGHVPTSTGVTGIKVRFCGRFVGRIYECSSRLDAWNRLNLVKEGRGDRFTAESLRLSCNNSHLSTVPHHEAEPQSLQNDADQQRLSQQQALPHQRHAPLHGSRQQHGRDHHGAQPAQGSAPGGAGGGRDGGQQQQQQRRRRRGATVSQQAEGHVRALPAPQVHQERHGVGSAQEGDEQRHQLPGDGSKAGGAGDRHRGGASG